MNYFQLAESLLTFLQELVNEGRAKGALNAAQIQALEDRAVNLFGGTPVAKPVTVPPKPPVPPAPAPQPPTPPAPPVPKA